MRNLLLIFCGSALISIISCGKDNITPTLDPAIQRAIDIGLINDFIFEKGYTSVDTTESGVRYLTLAEGTGTEIDESDIVSFNYTASLLNDTIFDTSIKEVADSIYSRQDTASNDVLVQILLDNFSSDNDYSPFKITYSSSGWSFAGLIDPVRPDERVLGFEDGVAASFRNLKVGGSARMMVPSDLGYGLLNGTLIPANSVLVFDVYPIKVEKQ